MFSGTVHFARQVHLSSQCLKQTSQSESGNLPIPSVYAWFARAKTAISFLSDQIHLE